MRIYVAILLTVNSPQFFEQVEGMSPSQHIALLEKDSEVHNELDAF
ncbi:hypothetical protein [Chryseobacterium sp.]